MRADVKHKSNFFFIHALQFFAFENFLHGQHIQFVLVAPGILLEKNQISGRQIRDADAARFQVAQLRAKIVERFAAHPREDVQIKFLSHADRAFLKNKILRLEFAREAFAPLLQTLEKFAEIFRRVVNEDVGVQRQARIAVEDDRQSADHREINVTIDERGQQLFEPGNSLLRFWRLIHACFF